MPRRATRYRLRSRAYRRRRRIRAAIAARARRTRFFARRRTSRRRILNVAAIKKHDNMLPFVRSPDGDLSIGPIQVGTGFTSLFMPSARKLGHDAAGESTRERQLTYSVGYKERVEVNILGGGVWKWRRLVFTYKGDALYGGDPTWNQPFHNKATDPEGCDMVRLIAQPTTDQRQEIRRIIWDGTEGLDWSSEFTAKPDTSRITPLYDRIFTFNPRNESGYSRSFRFWHRTGKNLIYDEDEQGGAPHAPGSFVSVAGKPGMGDLYVYDIVYLAVPAAGGNASMQWTPEGTYYWHER
uniref:Capsid protein n=1 Tax=Genomoviridae sp. TaxID=2202565 RepID=A0A858NGA6_9VIRU|nr:MAG: capsid protein [Genomoviridae sp.]QXN75676.1 MAG: capsid protein [Genomoviridae sp.]